MLTFENVEVEIFDRDIETLNMANFENVGHVDGSE